MHPGIALKNRPHWIPRRQFFASLTYLVFTPVPFARDRINAGATGNLIRESEVVHDVEHTSEDGVLAIALNDALLVAVGYLDCLVCRRQGCADPGALSPGREHRCQGPPAATQESPG